MRGAAGKSIEQDARDMGSIRSANRLHFKNSELQHSTDIVIAEEPLELWLYYDQDANDAESFMVTMRTPGMDAEWATGFLLNEGMINHVSEIKKIHLASNKVFVRLQSDVMISREKRKYPGFSSCGVCGKKDIEALGLTEMKDMKPSVPFDLERMQKNLAKIDEQQDLFKLTGGVHAAGLLNREADLIAICEDVGRHNAVDKLVGLTAKENFDYSETALWVSSRISYEIIQKASMTGIPIVIGLGAVSSLAVELADHLGMSIVGFLNDNSFSIYTHSKRIDLSKKVKVCER